MNHTAEFGESLYFKMPYKPLPSQHYDVNSARSQSRFPFIPPPDYKEYHIHDRDDAHTVNFPYIPRPDYSDRQLHLWPRDYTPNPVPNGSLAPNVGELDQSYVPGYQYRHTRPPQSSMAEYFKFISSDRSARGKSSGSRYPFNTYGVPKYVEKELQHGPIIPTVFAPGGYGFRNVAVSPPPQNTVLPPNQPNPYAAMDINQFQPQAQAQPPSLPVVNQEQQLANSQPRNSFQSNVESLSQNRSSDMRPAQSGLLRHLQEHRQGNTLRSGVEFLNNCPICHAASTADLLLQKDPERLYNRNYMIKQKQDTLRKKDFKGYRQLEFLDELRSMQALTARVSRDRVARSSRELNVRKGEYLEVFDSGRSWFNCANVNGDTGLVPVDVLKIILWERVDDWLEEPSPPRSRRRRPGTYSDR